MDNILILIISALNLSVSLATVLLLIDYISDQEKKGEKRMKFIVDELPMREESCPFAEWIQYPPDVKEIGFNKCKLDDNKCGLWSEYGCRWMKEVKDTGCN